MLTLVTDQHPGEPDILTAFKHEVFEIRSLAGTVIATAQPPADGWTHDHLVAVANENCDAVSDGAEAYLGREWIGSTEV